MSLPPEDPAPTTTPRPADAARRALRAARERAGAEREPAPGKEETAPGDAARRALRAAREQTRAEPGAAPDRTESPAPGGVPGTTETTDTTAPADADAPAGAESPVTRSRPLAPPGGRPADVAREALRAARREALRAEDEAEQATVRGTRAADPRTRRGPRATGGPATTPPTAPAPGPDSRAARAKAVHDMRHYLANAFRMPAWSDTPEEFRPTNTGAHSGDRTPPDQSPAVSVAPTVDDHRDQSPSANAVSAADAQPGGSPAACAVPTGQVHADQSSSAAVAPSVDDHRDQWPSAFAGSAADAQPGQSPAVSVVPTVDDHRDELPPVSVASTGPDQPAPSPPRLPLTMATPHRDSELRRTFPEFAPRAATGEGASFAGTWWGNAWTDALEQGALDPKRLARGRGYADQGHVDAITVTPGLVLAYVRGSRPRPYRVQVRVRTLDDADWERFLDAAADRPGHIAALLDRELPQSLADCGIPLLPGPGDLAPRCSCPDSGHPCKHAAALCYQTARLLDADPFVLLLLRGRGEKDLIDALSRRSAAREARAAQDRRLGTLPGVRATEALAPRQLPPLPPPLPVPPHHGQPPVYPAAPGGPDPFALDQLAIDAAARAHALLGTGRDPLGGLTLWQDAVRLAAARPGSGLTATTRALYATLAAAVGRTPADLARAVAAWRQGGAAGLAVLEEPWDPPAGRFDRARPLLLAADLPAFRPWRNRLTHPRGHVQLRLGRDGLWYVYESDPGQDDWWPRGTPDLDPVGALTGLGTPEGQ
ncbi:SWIM zinc finger family protein [Streptomyces sp. FXJ1.172]|uniref:SWIM zinc finger family protein n=1 Tax=Streptomyces sp. FXJ1.172 TaxID=710705 RepID=UPI000B210A03|nr:SWIM zinc finger family protein [Streptomyces sp. FXJ1.172]WEO94430.1 SWIM zinc finger family protein [Streptomyces sp. FXJ1.172]